MAEYVPQRGDIVWLNFSPQTRHEQSGRRAALTVSAKEYNKKTGLAIFCPVTNKVKGYPFEVTLPDDSKINGAVLSDQVRNLDWKERDAVFICKAGKKVIEEVTGKIEVLISEK